LGLWDVLENCERKGSLDVHIKNQKKMIFNLYSKFSSHSKIIFNGKVIGISLKNLDK
jgi:G:T/U-mismatch repair DNA glycosylase